MFNLCITAVKPRYNNYLSKIKQHSILNNANLFLILFCNSNLFYDIGSMCRIQLLTVKCTSFAVGRSCTSPLQHSIYSC